MPTRPPAPNEPGFDDHFEQARSNIFRLETLQSYGNAGEDPALAAFEAGAPQLITPSKLAWVALVRDRTAAGCVMERVHIVEEPITQYLRFELTWSYSTNVAAGERIGIVAVPAGSWPPELPQCTDFWLFDFHILYALRYDQDNRWLGKQRVSEPAAVAAAVAWREAAFRLAVPWQVYIDAHPELAAIVPQGEPRAS